MPRDLNLLGIDIGTVSVSIAEIDRRTERLIRSSYSFHKGEPRLCLLEMLRGFDLSTVGGFAATSSTPFFFNADQRYDERLCLMTSCQKMHGKLGSILVVGGEKFGLIRFDSNGDYQSYKGNTSCAAGTGSFLDQQALRLKLDGPQFLSALACENHGKRPRIASRCAVFAKTDLVHAQQEGYNLNEICDGLCYGLAKNIFDTVFSGVEPLSPIVFVGGVSLNQAVVQHLEDLLEQKLIVDNSPFHGALGAALLLRGELVPGYRRSLDSIQELLLPHEAEKDNCHPPLILEISDFPEFRCKKKWSLTGNGNHNNPVEVDCYEAIPEHSVLEAYLGMDVGSTSTKALLMDTNQTVIAGFYTRTSGRPLEATQNILAAIDEQIRGSNSKLNILAAGTTGAGRKFVGKVIGADLVLNEISAHARAAVELNPRVDTIIEIGGQDSKFTNLKDGMVTFSVMNNVCAAGTGSFIEEQAEKLGCPLDQIALRCEDNYAPISSDRCTVFMERDINHFLNEGYKVDEVLASVLHSVVENYLTKVAVENQIGRTILFQGATAKNRALVAAFEQRLKKQIHVSKFCHLTGAMGVALTLAEKGVQISSFRGIEIHEKTIPIRSEVCSLCTNHCKITLAHLEDSKIAYGFLCGRDYDTRKYVDCNLASFDLLKARKQACSFQKKSIRHPGLTIAIPAALHLMEDLALWKYFFNELGIHTRVSERFREAVKQGKNAAGAEFCAPITALYGHIKYLQDTVRKDEGHQYIFVPFYLEKKSKPDDTRRQYCYYTQFAPALISALGEDSGVPSNRILTPLLRYLYHSFHTKAELYRVLVKITNRKISFFEVSSAFEKALEFKAACTQNLKRVYNQQVKPEELHVVLLGRPYSILSKAMNKDIPQILARLGVKTFFQDMLTFCEEDGLASGRLRNVLKEFQWYFAKEILQAADKVAQNRTAYPILITSFKCSPDTFTVERFKDLMEAYQKPYLILQLDEHDSRVGYETRIEAAIDSFSNHFNSLPKRKVDPFRYLPDGQPYRKDELEGKILLIPNWDSMSLPLVQANLHREGIDARLLKGSPTTIRRSLQTNLGQCTPLSIIAQEFIDYVREHHLDPARCLLWIPKSNISCNICMFPHYLQKVLQSYGGRMAKAKVYAGTLSFKDLSIRLPINIYFAHMFGGFLRKMACHIRPYECQKGSTDRVVCEAIRIFQEAVLENRVREEAVRQVVSLFKEITIQYSPRPKVAIFGDFYVRDNDLVNQDLIRFIEDNGGEVVTTPYSSLVQMISTPYLRKWVIEGDLLGAVSSKALLAMVSRFERTYLIYFNEVLGDSEVRFTDSAEKILSDYGVRIEHTGESMENLLKVHYIKKHYPGIELFVQTSPVFCCPSLVTEAMAGKIERKTGVPVVSITYDGTGGNKNEAIIPYLKCRRQSSPRKIHQILASTSSV